ncbi:hypothetical protein V6Z12_D01G167500 [Gossypium hirsutum]
MAGNPLNNSSLNAVSIEQWFGSSLVLLSDSLRISSLSSWFLQWLNSNNISSIDSKNFYTYAACTLWINWKSRNKLIFRMVDHSPARAVIRTQNLHDSIMKAFPINNLQSHQLRIPRSDLIDNPVSEWALSLCIVYCRRNSMSGGAVIAQDHRGSQLLSIRSYKFWRW